VASACGGRTALELGFAVEDTAAQLGGAPSASVGQDSAGSPSVGGAAARGGSPNSIGMTSSAGSPSADAGAAGFPAQPLVAIAVSASNASTCAVHENGTVWCWGATDGGQLGNGDSTRSDSSVLARVAGISTAIGIGSGGSSSPGGFSSFHCAVLRIGSVVCWGAVPGQRSTPRPVTIAGIHQAITVVGGAHHACALLAGGSIQCWGDNNWGQLGDGSLTNSTEPVTVVGIDHAKALGLSSNFSDFTCAVLSDGTIKCWGGYSTNAAGFLEVRSTPVEIPSSDKTDSFPTGGDQACVALPDGRIQCCCGEHPAVLTTVPKLPSSSGVSVGLKHACALLSDGAVRCWGPNDWDELGSPGPGQIDVLGIPDAVALSAGWGYSCAVRKGGSVWCWGRIGGAKPVKVAGF